MQANFDARTGAAGTPAGPIERRQPEARKDRWMLELERAAMADSAAAKAAPRAAGNAAGAAQGQAAPAQDSAAASPLRPDAAAHHGARHGAAGLRAPQFGVGAGAAGWNAAAPAGAAPLQWAVAPAGAGLAAAASQPGVAPAAPAAIALAGLQAALGAGAPLALLAGAMPEPEAGGEAPAPDAPAPNPAQPEGEDYARRLLHLYSAEDGVHAWLRDASLSQAQVRRVASAMAGELALAGSPLAALTVNGRRILSPGAAGDQPGRRAADHPGAAAEPQLAPVASKGA